MASRSAFFRAFALILSTFPDRAPQGEHKDLILKAWMKSFEDLTDEELLTAASKVILSRPTLFPGDNLIAIIRETARPGPTQGDALELLDAAVSRFGRYRDDEALAWIEAQNPVAGAAVRRFGFLNWCDSTNQETARAQFRNVFNEERERFQREGKASPTALIGEIDLPKLLKEKGPGSFLAGGIPMPRPGVGIAITIGPSDGKEDRGGPPTRLAFPRVGAPGSDRVAPPKTHREDPLFGPPDPTPKKEGPEGGK
jgi:hypothetical protein